MQLSSMTPTEFYRAERDQADRERDGAASRARVLSRLRLFLMLLAVGTALVSSRMPPALAWTLGLGAVTGFLVAVQRHRRVLEIERAAWSRSRAASDGIARIERRWSDLAPPAASTESGGWPERIARDLGVTGDRSLMHLLGAPRSALGARRLLEWLLDDPASIDVLERRQQSVRVLRGQERLLLAVAANAQRSAERPSTARAISAFVAWCEDAGSAPASALLSRALSVGLVALGVTGALLRSDVGNALIALSIAGQLVMTGAARRRINQRTKGTETAVSQLDGLVRISEQLVAAPDVEGGFGEIQRHMRTERITGTLRGLVRVLAWNDMRYSPLSHWMANALVGFDVHLDAALEQARARHKPVARAWIEQLSDALALLSLATMAFEHADWIIPRFDDAPTAAPLDASTLAHPLLGETAVPNDARLLAPGATLVVSGPNMAGKTTYLRAIGINVLLAQAGGAVRAEHMQLARCRVRSSIRVEDDLGHGVSLFLAEILRTRDIVTDAENAAAPRVMFLFDEILHGTNSEDRRLATRAVQERLQRAGAVGVVTTHDPLIATGAAVSLHFDAEIGRDEESRPTLRFDYRVAPGPAVRTNALALVELYLSPSSVIPSGARDPLDDDRQEHSTLS